MPVQFDPLLLVVYVTQDHPDGRLTVTELETAGVTLVNEIVIGFGLACPATRPELVTSYVVMGAAEAGDIVTKDNAAAVISEIIKRTFRVTNGIRFSIWLLIT